MQRREEGLVEIYTRILNAKDTLGLKGFKRTPTSPVTEQYLPCIFMIEDIDEVVIHSSRGSAGYPCRRALEVTLEIVTNKDADIKQLYREVRSVIFSNGVIVADDNTFIREIRTEGPTGYGLPDVLGMRLVLALSYNDDGN